MRGKYKRKKYNKYFRQFKNNPIKFIEDIWNIKLNWCQKIMLNKYIKRSEK